MTTIGRMWSSARQSSEKKLAEHYAPLYHYAVKPGTGGVRKLRFAPPSWRTGKSGAARVCYIVFIEAEFCYLFALFSKNEKPNLSGEEKRELQTMIPQLKSLHRRKK